MHILSIYEDDSCAVINKPAGVLVHPVAGDDDSANTVAKWWSRRDDVTKSGWADNTRVGIAHRLDKDTSGALLLAKTPQSLEYYQAQFKKRKVVKIYEAIVFGAPDPSEGKVASSISRDNKDRTHRRSQLINFGAGTSKKAVSLYKMVNKKTIGSDKISLVEFNIKTGRTHQIRAHAKMLGCPVLGDSFYSTKPSRRLSKKLGISRQLLHARTLKFVNMSGKTVNVEAPTPLDINLMSSRTPIDIP